MNLFMMLNYIKKYYRNKLVKNIKKEEKAEFVNLQEVSSIGFVYNIDSSDHINELLDICTFLRSVQIHFKGLVVESKIGVFGKLSHSKKIDGELLSIETNLTDEELSVVNYKDLSWLGVPDSSSVTAFLQNKYDLYISFNRDNNFTLNYISHKVNARLMVGMIDYPGMLYNMVMEGKGKSVLPPVEYLKQVFHYLNIIKSNTGEN